MNSIGGGGGAAKDEECGYLNGGGGSLNPRAGLGIRDEQIVQQQQQKQQQPAYAFRSDEASAIDMEQ
jgi:hypothetical protein